MKRQNLDSRQFFGGFTVETGKETTEEMRQMAYHCRLYLTILLDKDMGNLETAKSLPRGL